MLREEKAFPKTKRSQEAWVQTDAKSPCPYPKNPAQWEKKKSTAVDPQTFDKQYVWLFG